MSECVDLELSVEDKTEEAEINAFFDGELCCVAGPKEECLLEAVWTREGCGC